MADYEKALRYAWNNQKNTRKDYTVSFDAFKKDMESENVRRSVWNNMTSTINDYKDVTWEDFNTDMGYGKSSKGQAVTTPANPQVTTTVATTPISSDEEQQTVPDAASADATQSDSQPALVMPAEPESQNVGKPKQQQIVKPNPPKVVKSYDDVETMYGDLFHAYDNSEAGKQAFARYNNTITPIYKELAKQYAESEEFKNKLNEYVSEKRNAGEEITEQKIQNWGDEIIKDVVWYGSNNKYNDKLEAEKAKAWDKYKQQRELACNEDLMYGFYKLYQTNPELCRAYGFDPDDYQSSGDRVLDHKFGIYDSRWHTMAKRSLSPEAYAWYMEGKPSEAASKWAKTISPDSAEGMNMSSIDDINNAYFSSNGQEAILKKLNDSQVKKEYDKVRHQWSVQHGTVRNMWVRKEISAIDKKIAEIDARIKEIQSHSSIDPITGNKMSSEYDKEEISLREHKALLDYTKNNYLDGLKTYLLPGHANNSLSSEALKAFGKGIKDSASDPNTWLWNIPGLVQYKNILKPIVDKSMAGTELTEEEADALHSLLFSQKAAQTRSGDISNAYSGAQTAINSLAFMAEFLLTGGIGATAAKGALTGYAKAVIRKEAKQRAIQYLKKEGVQATKQAVKRETSRIFKEMAVNRGNRLVSNMAARLGERTAVGELATAATAPVQAALHPSFWTSIYNDVHRGVKEDESGKIVEDTGTIWKAVAKALIEEGTELNGEAPLKLLGWGTRALSTTKAGSAVAHAFRPLTKPFEKMARSEWAGSMRAFMNQSNRYLKAAGINSLPAEFGEEIQANLDNLILANASINHDKRTHGDGYISEENEQWLKNTKDFWSKDSWEQMVIGFSGMPFVGSLYSVYNYKATKRKAKNADGELRKTLAGFGVEDEKKDALINAIDNANYMQDIAKTMTSFIDEHHLTLKQQLELNTAVMQKLCYQAEYASFSPYANVQKRMSSIGLDDKITEEILSEMNEDGEFSSVPTLLSSAISHIPGGMTLKEFGEKFEKAQTVEDKKNLISKAVKESGIANQIAEHYINDMINSYGDSTAIREIAQKFADSFGYDATTASAIAGDFINGSNYDSSTFSQSNGKFLDEETIRRNFTQYLEQEIDDLSNKDIVDDEGNPMMVTGHLPSGEGIVIVSGNPEVDDEVRIYNIDKKDYQQVKSSDVTGFTSVKLDARSRERIVRGKIEAAGGLQGLVRIYGMQRDLDIMSAEAREKQAAREAELAEAQSVVDANKQQAEEQKSAEEQQQQDQNAEPKVQEEEPAAAAEEVAPEAPAEENAKAKDKNVEEPAPAAAEEPVAEDKAETDDVDNSAPEEEISEEEAYQRQVINSIPRRNGELDLDKMNPEQEFIYTMRNYSLEQAVKDALEYIDELRKSHKGTKIGNRVKIQTWTNLIEKYTGKSLEDIEKDANFAPENQTLTENGRNNAEGTGSLPGGVEATVLPGHNNGEAEPAIHGGENQNEERSELDTNLQGRGSQSEGNNSVGGESGQQGLLGQQNQPLLDESAAGAVGGNSKRIRIEDSEDESNQSVDAVLQEHGITDAPVHLNKVSSEDFSNAYEKSIEDGQQNDYVDEPNDCQCYLSEDGTAGVSVSSDGNVFIFTNDKSHSAYDKLIAFAIEKGGKKSETFDQKTAEKLAQRGAVVTAIARVNNSYKTFVVLPTSAKDVMDKRDLNRGCNYFGAEAFVYPTREKREQAFAREFNDELVAKGYEAAARHVAENSVYLLGYQTITGSYKRNRIVAIIVNGKPGEVFVLNQLPLTSEANDLNDMSVQGKNFGDLVKLGTRWKGEKMSDSEVMYIGKNDDMPVVFHHKYGEEALSSNAKGLYVVDMRTGRIFIVNVTDLFKKSNDKFVPVAKDPAKAVGQAYADERKEVTNSLTNALTYPITKVVKNGKKFWTIYDVLFSSMLHKHFSMVKMDYEDVYDKKGNVEYEKDSNGKPIVLRRRKVKGDNGEEKEVPVFKKKKRLLGTHTVYISLLDHLKNLLHSEVRENQYGENRGNLNVIYVTDMTVALNDFAARWNAVVTKHWSDGSMLDGKSISELFDRARNGEFGEELKEKADHLLRIGYVHERAEKKQSVVREDGKKVKEEVSYEPLEIMPFNPNEKSDSQLFDEKSGKNKSHRTNEQQGGGIPYGIERAREIVSFVIELQDRVPDMPHIFDYEEQLTDRWHKTPEGIAEDKRESDFLAGLRGKNAEDSSEKSENETKDAEDATQAPVVAEYGNMSIEDQIAAKQKEYDRIEKKLDKLYANKASQDEIDKIEAQQDELGDEIDELQRTLDAQQEEKNVEDETTEAKEPEAETVDTPIVEDVTLGGAVINALTNGYTDAAAILEPNKELIEELGHRDKNGDFLITIKDMVVRCAQNGLDKNTALILVKSVTGVTSMTENTISDIYKAIGVSDDVTPAPVQETTSAEQMVTPKSEPIKEEVPSPTVKPSRKRKKVVEHPIDTTKKDESRKKEIENRLTEIAEERSKIDDAVDFGDISEAIAAERYAKLDEEKDSLNKELSRLNKTEFMIDDQIKRDEEGANHVIEMLQNAGLTIRVIQLGEVQDYVSKANFERLQKSDGTLYGFVNKDGEVFLINENLNPNTPIHEYTHLWVRAYSKLNPKGFASTVKILSRTPEWQEIAQATEYGVHFAESGMSEEEQNLAIASEVMAILTARRGTQVMGDGRLYVDTLIEQSSGKLKAIYISARNAINNFVAEVAKAIAVHIPLKKGLIFDLAVNHILNAPLSDLANGKMKIAGIRDGVIMQDVHPTATDDKIQELKQKVADGESLSVEDVRMLSAILEEDIRNGQRPVFLDRFTIEELQVLLGDGNQIMRDALSIAAVYSHRTRSAVTEDDEFQQREIENDSADTMEEALEEYAREVGHWSDDLVAEFNEKYGAQMAEHGGESHVWRDQQSGRVVKATSVYNYNTIQDFIEGIIIGNNIFPSAGRSVVGFGIKDERATEWDNPNPVFCFVMEQPFIEGTEMDLDQAEEMMKDLGFARVSDHMYTNGVVVISDMKPDNMRMSSDGMPMAIDGKFGWASPFHYGEEEFMVAGSPKTLNQHLDEVAQAAADREIKRSEEFERKNQALDMLKGLPVANTKHFDNLLPVKFLLDKIDMWRADKGLPPIDRSKYDVYSQANRVESAIESKKKLFTDGVAQEMFDELSHVCDVLNEHEADIRARLKDSTRETPKHFLFVDHVDGTAYDAFDLVEFYLLAKDNVERTNSGRDKKRGEESEGNNAWGDMTARLGMSATEFIDYFDSIVGIDEVNKTHAKVKAVSDYTLDVLHAAGYLSDEKHDELKQRLWYVPQKGFKSLVNDSETPESIKKRFENFFAEEDLIDGIANGMSDADRVDFIRNNMQFHLRVKATATAHTAEGRQSMADAPVANLMYDAYNAIAQAERNMVKRAMWDVLEDNQDFCDKFLFTRKRFWAIKDASSGKFKRESNPPSPVDIASDKLIDARLHDLREKRNELIKKSIVDKQSVDQKDVDDINDKINKLEGMKVVKMEKTDVKVDLTKLEPDESGEPRVQFYINGVLHQMEFPSANHMGLVADALNGFVFKSKFQVPLYNRFKGYVCSMYTMHNPFFFITNMERDVPTIIVLGSAKYGPEFTGMFMRELRSSTSIMDYVEGNLDTTTPEGALLARFLEQGGNTGFNEQKELAEFKANVRRSVRGRFTYNKKTGNLNVGSNILAGLRYVAIDNRVMAGFEALAQWSELKTRFSVYSAMLKLGYSENEALIAAKNLSTNFNTKGRGTKGWNFLNSMSMFSNANIQGARNGIGLLKEGNKGAAVLGFRLGAKGVGMVLTIATLGYLNTCLVPDDDDDEFRVSDFMRENFILLGRHIKVPISDELKAYWNLGVQLRLMELGKKNPAQGLASIVSVAVNGLLRWPANLKEATRSSWDMVTGRSKTGSTLTGVANIILNAITPNAMSSAKDIAQDKDFIGGSLTKDYNDYAQAFLYPGSMQIDKDLSKALYEISGDLSTMKTKDETGKEINGLLNLSPKQVDALASLVIASDWWKIINLPLMLKDMKNNGSKLDVKHLPLVSRVYYDSSEENYRLSTYIELNKIYKRIEANSKGSIDKEIVGWENRRDKLDATQKDKDYAQKMIDADNQKIELYTKFVMDHPIIDEWGDAIEDYIESSPAAIAYNQGRLPEMVKAGYSEKDLERMAKENEMATDKIRMYLYEMQFDESFQKDLEEFEKQIDSLKVK